MKNCAVALCGSRVRAIASVPISCRSPALKVSSASFLIGSRIGFSLKSAVKPPPWTMKPRMTRWNTVPS